MGKNKEVVGKPVVWKSRKRTLFLGLPFSFTKYSLTEEKLLVNSGFFNQREEEVRLYRILDLSLSRSFGQRLSGLGTITCKTSDKTLQVLELKNIKNSKEVKEQLSDLIENERIKKKVSSREYMNDDDLHDDGCDCECEACSDDN